MGLDGGEENGLDFLDDFTNPSLGRYYDLQPGVGEISIRPGGLHYAIIRAPDGPPSSSDHLTIDSLGRPQPPTARAVLRYPGTHWEVSIKAEYDFEAKSNGRAACVWIVLGEPSDRYDRGVSFVRSADLDLATHHLSFVMHHRPNEPVGINLTTRPKRHYWFRVARTSSHMKAEWSDDGNQYTEVMAWDERSAPSIQSIVINSSSFAGGASFVVRSIAIKGSRPIEVESKPPLFRVVGTSSNLAVVPAVDVAAAMSAGRGILLEACAIVGSIDLARVASPLVSDIRIHACDFRGAFYASNPVTVSGAVSVTASQFAAVGLSSVRFTKPFEAVGCQFLSDTRFIQTAFDGGADFSLSSFQEKPFFRIMTADYALSMYYCNFSKGADFSGSRINGDLSISDIELKSGILTFHRASIGGIARFMVTLQRDPQVFGGSIDFSNATLGGLVISSGDRENRGEYTGPPQWDLEAAIFLRESTVGTCVLHNVRFLKTIDLRDSKIKSVQKKTAQFSEVIGAWPVDTEFYSCFISYSSKDQAFTKYLHARLTNHGVRCWYAPKDLKIGDPFRQRIDDAIHEHDKLLLVLSEESVKSDWVREEVEACFERERRERTTVLFPIRLDDAIMNAHQAWAASIRRQRHIGDFRGWTEEELYHEGFDRLLRDLKAGGHASPTG
jgi:hypothetical protein